MRLINEVLMYEIPVTVSLRGLCDIGYSAPTKHDPIARKRYDDQHVTVSVERRKRYVFVRFEYDDGLARDQEERNAYETRLMLRADFFQAGLL